MRYAGHSWNERDRASYRQESDLSGNLTIEAAVTDDISSVHIQGAGVQDELRLFACC